MKFPINPVTRYISKYKSKKYQIAFQILNFRIIHKNNTIISKWIICNDYDRYKVQNTMLFQKAYFKLQNVASIGPDESLAFHVMIIKCQGCRFKAKSRLQYN